MSNALNSQRFVRTPPAIAELLTRWALRSSDDHVLDAGFGEGTFLLESARSLQKLGTSTDRLASQLHGIDARPEASAMLRQTFSSHGLPTNLPGIRTGDFFTSSFPPMDAMVGNPPIVHHWRQQNMDALRAAAAPSPETGNFSRLTDPQCYFVIHGAQLLKPGGRLALIVSDSWMDMQYGTAFKDYLLRTFAVRGLLGFQARIFRQVRVRSVVLLAEKRSKTETGYRQPVAFVTFNGQLPGSLPHDPCRLLARGSSQTDGTIVPLDELKPEAKWTRLLYAPEVYKTLREHTGLAPLGSLAQVRLGLQTFAKNVLRRAAGRPTALATRTPLAPAAAVVPQGLQHAVPYFGPVGAALRSGVRRRQGAPGRHPSTALHRVLGEPGVDAARSDAARHRGAKPAAGG